MNILKKSTQRMAAQSRVVVVFPVAPLAQGFGIGFANAQTLIFFLALFSAFLSGGFVGANAQVVLYYSSAIVLTGVLALAPYVLASLGKSLNLASGAALMLIGDGVIAQSEFL